MKKLSDLQCAEQATVPTSHPSVASIAFLDSIRSKLETSERKAAVAYSTLKRVYAARASASGSGLIRWRGATTLDPGN
jgi:hypothetical protein